MRPAQQFGQNHAGLGVPVVVRLQAGENQVKLLIFNGRKEGLRGVEWVQPDESMVFQVDRAIGALGEGLTQNLGGTGRASGDHNHFSAVFFFLPQGLLKGVGVGLIDLVGDVFPNPGAGFIELEGRVLLRDLLHADQDFHQDTPWPRPTDWFGSCGINKSV